MTDVSGEKAQIFNDFLLVFSLLTMAALQSYLTLSVLTPIYTGWPKKVSHYQIIIKSY